MSERTPAPPPAAEAAPSLTPAPSALRLGPRAELAAALVTALTRAARAFTLYDPANALIRQFLGEFQARAQAATGDGDVSIDVSPYELRTDGEVIYREEDREKSLAFRLYRDGVRQVTFGQGASFDELLRLLQILAIRFTGIRQAEDDIVTLLRKAELATVRVVAAEGFTADEGEAERQARALAAAHPLAPSFDTPFPRLAAPGPIAFQPVPDAALDPLRAEAAPEAAVASGLQVAAELLAHAGRAALPASDVAQFCAELRDFLLADRHLAALAALADLVQAQPPGPLRDEVLRGLADPRLLEAVLAVVPAGRADLPSEAVRLLPFVPSASVLDLLAADPGERREALVALVAARLPADADAVLARLPSLPSAVARALAKALGARAPARMAEAAVALLGHADEAIQLDALRAVAVLPPGLPAQPVVAKLSASSEAVRVAAARALERQGGAASARAVSDALTTRRSYSRDEAAALGHALGVLNAGAALRQFDAWLPERRGLLKALKSSEHEDLLRWAAVAGLGAIPGAEAEERLEAVAATKDEALRLHCRATLARRHAGEGHGRRG
jgi:hypothetical protein